MNRHMRISGIGKLWIVDFPHYWWVVPPGLSLCLIVPQVRVAGGEYSLQSVVRPNGLVSEPHLLGKCGFLPQVVVF